MTRTDARGDTPRRRLSPRLRRRQLLDGAFEILSREGTDALRLSAVAEHAGVSRPAVYRHFASRTHLIAALIRDCGDDLLERIQGAMLAHGGEADPTIRAGITAHFDSAAVRGQGWRRLLSCVAGSPDLERAWSEARNQHVRFWAQLIVAETGVSASEARTCAWMLIASADAVIARWQSGALSRRRAEALQRTMCSAALEALGKRRG